MAPETQLSSYALEERLVTAVRDLGGDVTAGDVAARSGLPLGEVEQGLRDLLSLYKSHLDVDDDGNLRYRFDAAMTRRGSRDAGHWLHKLRAFAWSAFVFSFKAGIMITLVGYTAVFVIILLALAVAALGAMFGSDSDSDGLGELLFLPLRLLAELLEFVFWFNIFSDSGSRRGRGRGRGRIKRFHERVEKPFYQKIFDFVFGPQPQRDPLAIHRAFAGFILERRGRVTAAEWASRSGQSLEDAERALTAALIRFGGDVEVDDDAQLVYTFDELRITTRDNTSPRGPDAIWERTASAPPLTGNPKSTNRWIGAFNAFNLVMSTIVTFYAATAGGLGASALALGIFPLVFSFLFFAIPAARRVRNARLKREAIAENARREAFRRIWQSTDGGIARAVAASEIHSSVRDELARDFDAELDLDEATGALSYRFETLAAQRRAADTARRNASAEVVFGRSVFSSDEQEVSSDQADLDEFDRLLAAELGDDAAAFDFEAAPAYARS